MTVLVFGKTGQVATGLQRTPGVVALDRSMADLRRPETCAEAIFHHHPKAVINAAAYTAVDQAEHEEALATVINAEAPAAMAQACKALNIPFLHISTDYVFAGDGAQAWKPDDQPAPKTAYGRTKQRGEEAVCACGGRFVILRTSWVFSAQGHNFVKAMLRVSEVRRDVAVVADQVGGPTPAQAIADACIRIVGALEDDASKAGIYHFSGTPELSWADFARDIFEAADRPVTVSPLASREYHSLAARPLNSRLNCQSTEASFGLERPDWRPILMETIADLGNNP
jgi:dTDP-4-dehydrorhamnose reductase